MKGAHRIDTQRETDLNLESVVVSFGFVLVVFQTHEANGEKAKSQDNATDETGAIESGEELHL